MAGPRWGCDVANGPPVAANGVAVVPQQDLVGIDIETGAVRWRFGGFDGAAGGMSPVVSGDTVFTATLNGWVYAVAAVSGDLVWSRYDPVLSEELVIVPTRGRRPDGGVGAGDIIALRKTDGTEHWRPGGDIISRNYTCGTVASDSTICAVAVENPITGLTTLSAMTGA